MILSDNETTIDRLNNRAIAVTIADIIKNSSESVSIGVHGDWGAGKSSVLAMVETELNPDATCVEDVAEWDEKDEVNWEGTEGEANTEETYLTVRFNSWQYLGFEDAKIALMSAIVSGLEKKAKAYYKKNRIKGGLKKLKNIAKRTWDNLDKLGLVKSVGKLGIATISGAWPLIITGSVAGTFKYIADNPDILLQRVFSLSILAPPSRLSCVPSAQHPIKYNPPMSDPSFLLTESCISH